MIRDGEPAMGRLYMPEDDVAALLPIYLVPEAPEGRYCFTTRDAREGTHTATSMTSS
jgi:hypothetical protein